MTPNISIRSFSTDQYYLDKILYANFYRLRPFNQSQNVQKEPVVVDIGAHCGFFTWSAIAFGAKKVYAFEPFLENYRMFLKNLEDTPEKIISYQLGIYISEHTLPLAYPNVERNAYFDFGKINIDASAKDMILAPAKPLDFILESLIPETIDVLKISIGYAEKELLVKSDIIGDKVRYICGQAELDETSILNFKSLMGAKGFIDSHFAPVHDEDGKVLFHFSKTKCSDVFDIS